MAAAAGGAGKLLKCSCLLLKCACSLLKCSCSRRRWVVQRDERTLEARAVRKMQFLRLRSAWFAMVEGLELEAAEKAGALQQVVRRWLNLQLAAVFR